tara:strand:- start:778 stop:1425 length:648 start_codon:yes stop_codon:yes gene_type:complete
MKAIVINSIHELLKVLLDKIAESKPNHRLVVSLSGAPGSGKSYVSKSIIQEINKSTFNAAIFEMDGFHYDNSILEKKSLLDKKGSPETFDVNSLTSFLKRIKKNQEDEIAVPVFDRSLELSRSSAYLIKKNISMIIAEGNYLLLNQKPWSDLHQYFDLTIMVKSSESILTKRLIDRWQSFKLDEQTIKNKVFNNDLPNGRFVYENSKLSDIELIN